MSRLISLIDPLVPLLPEVKAPPKDKNGKPKVDIGDKLKFTIVALGLYLWASNMPLYGVRAQSSTDAFYIMRMMLASQKNTLMELGISPIITSGMIMQLLVGAKILDVDMDVAEDRKRFNAANKILGLIITVGEALAYVLAGNYGPLATLGAVKAVLLIGQLVFSGFLVLMLDDLLAKGWGLGSGLNLFIVTNICEGVVWACLSPMTLSTGAGGASQFEGALVNLVHGVVSEPNKLGALYNAFFRADLPNLMNVLATVVVFALVCFVQGWQNSKIKLRHEKQPPGTPLQEYPIKLFYTSNMPIILLSALVSSLYFFSQVLFRRYKGNPLVRLLGVWDDRGGRSRPVWGLSYLLSPPGGLTEVFTEPFHAVFYIAFMLGACALFALAWVDISGSGPSSVRRQLEANKMEVQRPNSFRSLGQNIRTAAMLGGMCVAALSIFADLFGAIGSGTGILMAVTIIYDLRERAMKDGAFAGLQQWVSGLTAAAKQD